MQHIAFPNFQVRRSNALAYARLVFVALATALSSAAHAQSFEETVSFIFTGLKDANSVKWNVTGPIVASMTLSNFNQKACTVTIEQAVEGAVLARGTLRLKDMTGARVQRQMKMNWNPQPYSFTFLEITSVGRIFDGSIRTNRDDPIEADCHGVCRITVPPVSDTNRLITAFQHLWTEYCPRRNDAF